jgi:hypothetical protein
MIASLLCLGFGLTLHASVPSNTSSRVVRSAISSSFDPAIHPSEPLPLTAVPADRQSFYQQFYSTEELPAPAAPKPGPFRRLASVIKKTAQKVNLIPN